ncbi:IQ calmodulin-binding motif-containing protein 1 [Scleropages formosus]|uniref:IQ motif containing B1 n=1 Tax=Scleropages formosus TaxID=113540 RepID=A0A8C9SJ06_SCLFO|nr:IQ calmodulin-binding motif-containing protein 1 [Scleropages formosus]
MTSSKGGGGDVDPSLRALLPHIESTNHEAEVPELLLKLTDALDRRSVQGSRALERFKRDLFTSGVLQYCSDALRFEYAHVEGGLHTAAHLADVLSACCVGVDPVTSAAIIHSQLLQSVAENMTFLATRVMERVVETKDDAQKIRQFRKIFDSICWLLKGHSQLIPHVLQSKHYQKIQLSENEDVGGVLFSFLQNLVGSNSAFLTEIRPVVLEGILDDIVYKLGCGSSAVLGGGAARTLLLVAKSHSSIARSIPRKYRGLDALLKTDWRGKGFDAVVEQLLDLLYSEAPSQGASQDSAAREVKAACVIQAAWRAFLIRRRMKMLPRAVSTLQRSFREKKRREELQSQRKKAEEELRLQVRLRRQRALREFHQRQLYLLEIVPAGQVDKYLAEVESRAAVIIQKVWRGHRERRSFQQQKEALGQFKAAVTIQRAVLQFLKRRRILQSTLSPWRGPKGLTDARRAELMKQVEEHMARHPGGPMSPERCRELHRRTQEMLRQYLMGREVERRAEHHGQALLAQINTDIELLTNAPPLKDVAEVDSDLYLSRSGPVAYRARQSHNALLNASRYPWWKRLGDEFQDPESVPAENLAENFESLYFG